MLHDQIGLYRDAKSKEIEKPKQKVTEIFESNSLKLTIDANKKVVNFLDVTFNLANGTFKPYIKPNNTLLYVHSQSNHPPLLLKNIPLNINKRLSSISSNQDVFNETIAQYQRALDESGYNHKLVYNQNTKKTRIKPRKRNILRYNPPWDSQVKTNLGEKVPNSNRQMLSPRPPAMQELVSSMH